MKTYVIDPRKTEQEIATKEQELVELQNHIAQLKKQLEAEVLLIEMYGKKESIPLAEEIEEKLKTPMQETPIVQKIRNGNRYINTVEKSKAKQSILHSVVSLLIKEKLVDGKGLTVHQIAEGIGYKDTKELGQLMRTSLIRDNILSTIKSHYKNYYTYTVNYSFIDQLLNMTIETSSIQKLRKKYSSIIADLSTTI
jgi:cell fate (sporulation/competence/biofilm development) regulator YmcA (YheA/YmcA/DUF963 family)